MKRLAIALVLAAFATACATTSGGLNVYNNAAMLEQDVTTNLG